MLFMLIHHVRHCPKWALLLRERVAAVSDELAAPRHRERGQMRDEEVETAFRSYLDAFAKSSAVEQKQLLQSSVADDVVFTNPGVNGYGIDELAAHIAVFREHFPGHYFGLRWLRGQNGQLLAEWTQFDGDGAEVTTAHSYARLNEDGRLAHIAGFWAPGSV
jgi:hypothetical protein